MGAAECQFQVTEPPGNPWLAACCCTETSTPLAMTVRPALTVSEKVAPFPTGADGVITSLLAGHCVPSSASGLVLVFGSSGEQAGGSGLLSGPPTGLVCDASWAAGFGSSCPFGSPG